MKVVDIHPEELIDKLASGSLTLAERERLNVHLAQCSSCRFEIGVRADLVAEAPVFEERPHLTFAGGMRSERALAAPRELPELQAPLSVRSRSRSRSRWPLSLLAAAIVLCAGGAMAAIAVAGGSGWLPWSAQPKPGDSNADAGDAKPGPKSKRTAGKSSSTPLPALEASANSAPSATSAPSERVAPPVRVGVAPTPPSARPRPAPAALENARSALPVEAGSTEAPARVEPAAALFADANRARRDGNLDRAVALYRSLQSRYPSSSESELSRALLAQLLLERGDPEAALAGFDRYLAEDTPVLSAEALVGRARALEQLGKSTQAAAAWRQVQSRFPGSVHARLAATRLAALGMR
jgi:TolA-binding protein